MVKSVEGNEEEMALYKLSTPNRLTNNMVDRPCCMICVGFVIMLLISMFTFYMEWLTPNNPNDRDYMVWGDPYVTNMDKSIQVSRELIEQFNVEDVEVPLQS